MFRGHKCMSMEMLDMNLYDLIKQGGFSGLDMPNIRKIAIQLVQALKALREERIIHCDLKPENILLREKGRSGVKLIDFGSSCFEGKTIYTYIQSRFYRAPEIIFGLSYTAAIDMWSLGCILAELYNGFPLFAGDSEQEQIGMIMEMKGMPPANVLQECTRKRHFFEEDGYTPLPVREAQTGQLLLPNSKAIGSMIVCEDRNFLKFVDSCLHWDPELRMTPEEALRHEWVLEGIPSDIKSSYKSLVGLELC